MAFNEQLRQSEQRGFDAREQVEKFCRSSDLFEERFKQGLRRYESPGGVINAVVVRPDNPKTDVPVLLAPGWAEGIKIFKNGLFQLYASDRIAITLDHPRRGGVVERYGDYPLDELRKAQTVLELIKQENIIQIDIIAHSEGAINAAYLRHERVRNLILCNPAGLIGKDSVLGLIGRFTKNNWQSFVRNIKNEDCREAIKRGQTEGIKYVMQNPVRAYREIRAISRSHIEETLIDLHSKGVGIVVIHGVDDAGFPMVRMQKHVRSEAQQDGYADGFLSVKGGHNELNYYPEKYIKAAEMMLTALEQKHAGKLKL